jgi:hypothetical protein
VEHTTLKIKDKVINYCILIRLSVSFLLSSLTFQSSNILEYVEFIDDFLDSAADQVCDFATDAAETNVLPPFIATTLGGEATGLATVLFAGN